MIIPSTADYQILYDRELPICLIGDTYYNHSLFEYFSPIKNCTLVRVEDVIKMDHATLKNYQFHSSCSNVAFKQFVFDQLDSYDLQWISIVGYNNLIFDNVSIGINTFINDFNFMQSDASIGNHCTVTTHSVIGHHATVSDFCHISAYSMINHTTLNKGNCVAARSSFFGKKNSIILTAPYCNFLTGSTVTKDILSSGTYFGNRRVSNETSLTYKHL
jgi:acetyltransferase-like isoleucine patch superfamily enzyme